MSNNQLVTTITEAVIRQLANSQENRKIPVGVSNRHVHLGREDVKRLFGIDAGLTKCKELSQPGQFACEETVTLVGSRGVIENVRVLGPTRNKTQVEISAGDGIKLGVQAPIRDSGDLTSSASITLVGSVGSITLGEGTIIAARHIHMHTRDAREWGLNDKERVSVKVPGVRGLVFNEVLVRVSNDYKLEMHIDIDEANAAFLGNNSHVEIVKK